ncbi:diacylglycerol/lipid kinase family protein [Lentilactobacillus raoultii]|uniref:Diacylglycerol/lipid kinase family protein n=1 Tax=Lentilactobacillus raoultii TaxID=1987503 RepID=A0ABW3PQ20_9LACO|nr:diacylglycerol kinase family protein [Lentilactobacillus raoultii]
MRSYLIMYNGTAGKSDNEAIAKKAQRVLSEADKSVDVVATGSEKEAVQQAASATTTHDCLVTIGGDGSINTACKGFLKAGNSIPLGIIPGGTVNNFARALKLPLDPDQAILTLLDSQPAKVDLATIGNIPMVSSLTLGRLADISQNVKQDEKRRFGVLIYLFKGLKELFTNRSYKLKITANGRSETLRAQILLITTTNSVGGNVAFNPDATYDDDFLHVFILKEFTLPKIMTYGAFFLSGNLKNARGVKYLKCKQIQIENLSSRDIKTRIDGDPAMALPITVRIKADFLRVLLPRKANSKND